MRWRASASRPQVEDVYVRRLADDLALIELMLIEPAPLLRTMREALPYQLDVRSAERLGLVPGVLELALELAVAVTEGLEVIVQLAQRQAQLRERKLDIFTAVAAAKPLVAERRSLISLDALTKSPRSSHNPAI